MSTQTSFQEKPTAKPVVAGIFNIVVGALCLFAALGVGIAAIVVGSLSIPFVTTVLLIILVPILVLGVIAVLGGLSVALGYRARVGAWLIVVFLVPVTLTMHAFWGVSDPMMAQMQMVMFMKNLSMLGAALLLAYHGAGPISFDRRRSAS